MLVEPRAAGGTGQVELPVPAMGAFTGGAARLLASRVRTSGLAWARPVRYVTGGLALLLMIGFVISMRRPRTVAAPA